MLFIYIIAAMERKRPPKGTGFTNGDHNTDTTSLAHKLKSHYRTNKSKNFHERVEGWTQFMVKLPLPVPLLLTTVLATWYFGVTEVVSEIYDSYGTSIWYLHVCFGTFLVWQLLVFWCGIRFVDSSFKAFKTNTITHNTSLSTTHGRCVDMQDEPENDQATVWDSYLLPGYCTICSDVRPARCHHCPICDVCVLKRDHHCYFAGSCVGWRNHRYFIVFCFWAAVGSSYVVIHLFVFIRKTLWATMSYSDLFAPCALLRCIVGRTSLSVVIYICMMSAHIYCILLGTKFVVEHIYLVMKGITTFENNPKRKELRVVDTRSVGDRIRSVFGRYYLVNCLIPTHWIFPSVENPISWPNIKIY